MITEAPLSPGTALPVYQPAILGFSYGGSSTSPSLLRPSFISGASMSIDGMSMLWGTTAARGSVVVSRSPSAERDQQQAPVTAPASDDPDQRGTRPSG